MSDQQHNEPEQDLELESGMQYVTFMVDSEAFGFPMASVSEIIRVPTTVDVPLTPSALTGLANLRGSVLPILDLRAVLGLPPMPISETTRVVVTDEGSPVGLVVDRVNQVLSVDANQIESSQGLQSSVNANLLSGVIKRGNGESMIQLLNVEQLIAQEFQAVLGSDFDTQVNTIKAEQLDADDDADIDQLVSFTVDQQEYAFDLMDVEGTLRIPESITRVPQSAGHVLGLIDLRGRLIPLISLRRLFHLPDSELGENDRILLVHCQRPDGSKDSVGLVVDQVREVLRVHVKDQDDMPPLLSRGQNNEEISKVCRLDKGRRLVSVINAEALLGQPGVAAAIEAHSEPGETTVETQIELDDDNAQLVVFLLNNQEYSVSIDDVQEITRVPSKMDKVPKTASFIEGMVNLRGTVLPVLDMRARFSIDRMDANDRQRIIVLSIDGTRTGFIVDSVAEVLRLPKGQIEASPSLSDDQARMIGQVVNLRDQKRMIQVLTVAELLSSNEVRTLSGEAA